MRVRSVVNIYLTAAPKAPEDKDADKPAPKEAPPEEAPPEEAPAEPPKGEMVSNRLSRTWTSSPGSSRSSPLGTFPALPMAPPLLKALTALTAPQRPQDIGQCPSVAFKPHPAAPSSERPSPSLHLSHHKAPSKSLQSTTLQFTDG